MPITTTKQLTSALWKTLPIPDSTVVDDADLMQVLWHYAGITIAPTIVLLIAVDGQLTQAQGLADTLASSAGRLDALTDATATQGTIFQGATATHAVLTASTGQHSRLR